MLGELLYEGSGKGSDARIRSSNGRTEANLLEHGKFKDTEVTAWVTWWSDMAWFPSQGETLYGEGEAVMVSATGEKVTWKGQGTINQSNSGKMRERGAIVYKTSSKGKMGFLNNVVGAYELDAEANLDFRIKVWEWK